METIQTISNIDYKYVNNHLEEKTKKFIIKEYLKYYQNRLSKSRYKLLYENMGRLIQDKNHNSFIIAADEKNNIVGSISVSKYDNRISMLHKRYINKNIAEIGRCYVLDKYKRMGIASKLFEQANSFARKKNYEKLYLHTHYFLPGGFNFWQKMGFKIVLDEKDSLQTVHMEKYPKLH